MRAIIYKQCLPIEHPDSLLEIELPPPQAGPDDLLVRIEAISVNPVDVKLRAGVQPAEPRVLGWDAVGIIEELGEDVLGFKPGERVWYAGELNRQGANAELQVVDARLVAHAPSSLSAAEAAALPLTSITAWELLFERFKLSMGARPSDEVLLISGAAGGVGSIMLQLARRLTSVTVIATAGRPESVEWVKALGAHHVIDYRAPLKPQLNALGIDVVTHVASLTQTEAYLAQFSELLAPFGQLALIDDPPTLDITPLKLRSLSVHWELMFTRSLFKRADMGSQGELLGEVAALVDAGLLRTTLSEDLGVINAQNLKRAHALIETGGSRGKLVLAGFEP